MVEFHTECTRQRVEKSVRLKKGRKSTEIGQRTTVEKEKMREHKWTVGELQSKKFCCCFEQKGKSCETKMRLKQVKVPGANGAMREKECFLTYLR